MAIIATPTLTITFLPHGVEALTSFGLFVDWGDDDAFTQDIDNISRDFVSGTYKRGATEELTNTPAGTFDFEVNDLASPLDYSPENTASRFGSGIVDPSHKVRLAAELDGVIYELWRGRIEDIEPHPDIRDATASFTCVDGFQEFVRATINAPRSGKSTGWAESPLVDTRSGDRGVTLVTGIDMTFADANPDTIVRASGSWLTDGYIAGMQVKVKGSAANDNIYTLATVVALTLTLNASAVLVAGGPESGVTVEVIGIIPEILDAIGWPVADRTIDPGVDQFALWWNVRKKAMTSVYEIEEQERSFAYIDGAGLFTWEDRHHRTRGSSNPHRTSQATFTDTMTDFIYVKSARSVINEVTIRGHKRVAQASAQVYGTQDRPKIGAGETIVLWADLPDPTSTIDIDTTSDGTDWKANTESDGSGIDGTSDVTLVANHYGQSVELILNNSGSVPLFLVPGTSDPDDTLYMVGLAFDDDPIVVTSKDTPSINKRGHLSGADIDATYKGSANNIQAFADWIITRFKVPTPDFVRMTLLGTTNALLKNLLALKVSDRITCTHTRLGITAQDYFIRGLEQTIEPGEPMSGVYFLEKVDAVESAVWALGVATLSELGQTTFLTL